MKKYLFLVFALLMLSARLPAQDSVTATLSAAGSTCAVTNACLILPIKANVGGVTFTASANASSNTLQFEATADGTTWVALNATPSNSTTAATSTTSTGTWQANPAGYIQVRIRMSTLVSGTATVTISTSTASARAGGGGGGGSGGAGGSLSTVYTFYPATTSNCAAANYSPTGTTYCAQNNITGAIDYSGTDAGPVIRSAIAAKSAVGGLLYFKTGVYNINSLALEAATGCGNFAGLGIAVAYGIGFPANTPFSNDVQWSVQGERNSVWMGESLATSVNTAGVVLNVTSTGVSSVAAGSLLNVIWQSPVTNCTLLASNDANDIYISNVDVRFPTNQRGNEVGINTWFANNHVYSNDTADFALTYDAIATGSAPVVGTYGSFGFTSSVSGSSNNQRSTGDFATGWDIGYDWLSEHTFSDNDTAIYTNYPFKYARVGSNGVYHNSTIRKFIDQENLNGAVLGGAATDGSQLNIEALDVEFGNDGNWYSSRGFSVGMTETNPCYLSGIITYSTVKAGTGNVVGTPLFSSGGQCFSQYNSYIPLTNPNSQIFQGPLLTQNADTFARANSSALGSFWLVGTQVGNSGIKVASNSAQVNSAGAASGYETYIGTTGQIFANNQASKATILSINNNANTIAEVTVDSSLDPTQHTFYAGYCSDNATYGSGIVKVVAGASTTLASQTSMAGCVTGDTIELRRIGTKLYFYKNGILDADFTPNPVTDATLSSGNPGLNLLQNTAGAVSLINFIATNNATVGASQTTNIGADSGVFPTLISKATVLTATAPSILAAGCGGSAASITSQNGTAAFKVNVGTSNAGSCAVTMPAAATDWVCSATDITTISTTVSQTRVVPTSGSLTTSITLANYTDISGAADWVDSDVLEVHCHGE